MRLIDADLLREEIEPILDDIFNSYPTNDEYNSFLNFIEEQPIAYDVDKVVERLQIMADEANDKIIEDNRECLYYDGYEDGINDAIEIVKEGGVNE